MGSFALQQLLGKYQLTNKQFQYPFGGRIVLQRNTPKAVLPMV
jgi:hypothetical protein